MSAGAGPVLPGTGSVLGVLHLPDGDAPAELEAARRRLLRLYRPVLPGCEVRSRWHEPSRTAVLAVTTTGELPARGRWGVPPAPADPAAGGPWVTWDGDDRTLTVRTSSTSVATLRTASSGTRSAWATRSLAVHALLGRRPAVRADVVAEHVLLDCTIGDDDLLDGTSRVPDGAVLTASADGVRTTTTVEDAVRYAPGEPTTPTRLRAAALEAAELLGDVPGACLGLTAGRDSGLLAAALVCTGRRPPAFTMGWPGLPDVDGAALRAARLGLDHRAVPLADLDGHVVASTEDLTRALQRRRSPAALVDAVLRRTRWSDGADLPRNALVGDLAWSGPPVVWLSGSGGELARALYWHEAPPGTPELAAFLGPRTGGLARPAADRLAERVTAELDRARACGRTGRGGLDVLYLRSRMRGWLGNVAPSPAFSGFLPGLLEPATVRVLLDVPEDQRRTGALFAAVADGLLAEGGAAGAHPPPVKPPGRRRLARLRSDPLSDARLLRRVLRRLDATGPGVAREVLGERWWRLALDQAPSRPHVRQWLWNAVAVDALAVVAADL
ncbi:MAG TPA: hypothetical protein VNU26_02775 [Mycobacteriales bacterium]|nr:hypothetical protein [Mycobacteriales bacterium]